MTHGLHRRSLARLSAVNETPTAQSWGFAEDFVTSSDALRDARYDAITTGERPISNGVASLLTVLARAINAKTVAEIGTGTGASGLALFAGMVPDGVLTSIDPDADVQLRARQAFTRAGLPSPRFRLIAGMPLEVLNKLRDGAYDLMFINGDKLEYVEYVSAALRLLRPGGLLVLHDALWHNLVADVNNEDDETVIIREALEAVISSEAYIPALLPVGNGLLVAARR
ncbi:MAG: class I SAM-dependent methyltransferase [Propionibacteriaceae bacterium]|nr:class I SAM-dependent methyltransferase [Propionibacteriaceae bacterium]